MRSTVRQHVPLETETRVPVRFHRTSMIDRRRLTLGGAARKMTSSTDKTDYRVTSLLWRRQIQFNSSWTRTRDHIAPEVIVMSSWTW